MNLCLGRTPSAISVNIINIKNYFKTTLAIPVQNKNHTDQGNPLDKEDFAALFQDLFVS